MAHRNFLIRYSNGFKRHVSKAELDLLGSKARQVGPREYFCDSLQTDLSETTGPNFLEGRFTIEYPLRYGRRREHERLETPKRMVAQLFERGFRSEVSA